MAKAKILIVEDERIVAGDIQSRVISLGYEVAGIVASGEEAVALADKTRPDLVLMDIMLKGGINGIQAAEQIITFFDIPVVYLTAYADEDTLQRVKLSGPFGYIVKPFEQRVLHTTIEIALYKHKMEQDIRRSEKRYRDLFEKSPASITLVDKSGVIQDCNIQTEQLTGYEKKDIVGKSFQELMTLDVKDLLKLKERYEKLLGGEIVKPYELEIITKEGTRRYIHVVNSLLMKDNEIVGFQVIANDITYRKQAEEKEKDYVYSLSFLSKTAMEFVKLTYNKNIYQYIGERVKELITEALLIGIVSFDEVADKFTIGAICGLKGYLEVLDKLQGRFSQRFRVSEETKERLLKGKLYKTYDDENLLTFLDLEKEKREELQMNFEAGDAYFMGLSQEGRLFGAVTIILSKGCDIDKTEVLETFLNQASVALQRRFAENELKESEKLYRNLVETSPDSITVTDLNGDLIMANQRAAVLYGVEKPDEVMGLNTLDIIASRDRKRAFDNARTTLKKERLSGIEYTLLKKNGSEFPAEVSSSVVRDVTGKPKGYIAVTRDITERKQTEEALRKSEERYRALTEEALVGVYIYSNRIRKYLFVNPAMSKITGYSREELLEIDPNELAIPEDREILLNREKAVREGKKIPSGYMIRIRRKDGSLAVLEVRTRSISDEGETAALGNCIDVSDIIHKQEQLERAKQEWERTFDATSDLVMIADNVQRIMRANRAVSEYTTLGYQELLEKTYFDVFHIKHAKRSGCPQEICIQTRQPQTAEIIDPQTGKVFSVSISPLFDQSGNATATVNVARDITDMRKMEKALSESEAKFRGIAESAKDIILSVDFNGTILYVNPALNDILGINPREYTGLNLLDPKNDISTLIDTHRNQLRAILDEDHPPLFEIELKSNEGMTRILEVSARKLSNVVVAIARDITERKHMEQQLIRASKMASVGMLVAGIAHQVNNPLAIMLSASTVLRDLLAKGDGIPEELQDDVFKYLDMMDEQVDRTRRVVSGLLAFTQARKSEIRPIDINTVVNEALNLLSQPLSVNNLEVTVSLGQNLPVVSADPVGLQQVIVNVIQNALDALVGEGKLNIVTQEQNDYVSVLISDNGPGVSSNIREEIFEPLFTTKSTRKGTGLGLSVSILLLERFGGRLLLEDTPGGGATFIIDVPVAQEVKHES
ncbi:PAS domain S-box protein [candidate division WOR-3 bacterium]|nr:PAS domain S-box protein [candidate division WOR-3 bacterium]